MTQSCPKCNADMKHIGQWPDYADEGRIKETFICEICAEPGKGKETVRREITT